MTSTNESKPLNNGYHDWKSLSAIYGLSEKTLRRRLAHVLSRIAAKGTVTVVKKKTAQGKVKAVKTRTRYFNQSQLKLIVLNIGDPMNYTFNGKKFIKDSE